MKNPVTRIVGLMALLVALAPQVSNAQSGDDWEYSFALYGWLPDISGSTTFGPGGGGDFVVPIGTILDNLEFTAQAAFNARKGKWGLVTDMIYMDLKNTRSNTRSGSIGGTPIPAEVRADLTIDLDSLILTGAGTYRFYEKDNNDADFLFGVRYLDMDQTLTYSLTGDIGPLPLPGPEGSLSASRSNLDFIVGLRGNTRLGENGRWFIPYYFDMGTGDSDFTWQAFAGIGYAFGWGELALTYRHLDYDLSSDSSISSAEFSGPSIGARWTW